MWVYDHNTAWDHFADPPSPTPSWDFEEDIFKRLVWQQWKGPAILSPRSFTSYQDRGELC